MRRKRSSEEQIVAVLKEAAAGMRTEETCRRHGICSITIYRWKANYAGDPKVNQGIHVGTIAACRASWSRPHLRQRQAPFGAGLDACLWDDGARVLLPTT